jgi:hypothetical protein
MDRSSAPQETHDLTGRTIYRHHKVYHRDVLDHIAKDLFIAKKGKSPCGSADAKELMLDCYSPDGGQCHPAEH